MSDERHVLARLKFEADAAASMAAAVAKVEEAAAERLEAERQKNSPKQVSASRQNKHPPQFGFPIPRSVPFRFSSPFSPLSALQSAAC